MIIKRRIVKKSKTLKKLDSTLKKRNVIPSAKKIIQSKEEKKDDE